MCRPPKSPRKHQMQFATYESQGNSSFSLSDTFLLTSDEEISTSFNRLWVHRDRTQVATVYDDYNEYNALHYSSMTKDDSLSYSSCDGVSRCKISAKASSCRQYSSEFISMDHNNIIMRSSSDSSLSTVAMTSYDSETSLTSLDDNADAQLCSIPILDFFLNFMLRPKRERSSQ
jgi:hypothetical protein